MMRIIAGLLIGLAVITLGFAVAIYGFGADNNLTANFSRIVPLPAAMVNYSFVSLAEVETLSRTEPENRQAVLDKLIRDEIVFKLLKARKASATSRESGEYYSHLLRQFDIEPENAAEEIARRFGLSEHDFKKLVVMPDYAAQKLNLILNREAVSSRESQRAQKVKELVGDGLDFAKAAASYSEDEDSRYISGDLGFMTLDEADPWLKAEVEKLETGKASAVVAAPDGYHVLRVANKNNEAQPAKYQVQHIFIAGQNLQEYLEKQIVNYRIYQFSRYK